MSNSEIAAHNSTSEDETDGETTLDANSMCFRATLL